MAEPFVVLGEAVTAAIDGVDGRFLSGRLSGATAESEQRTFLLTRGSEDLLGFVLPGGAAERFVLELPETLIDGQEHRLAIRCTTDRKEIDGSAVTVKIDPKESIQPRLLGEFHGVTGLVAQGWAMRENDEQRPVTVELISGGRVLAIDVADRFREEADFEADGFDRCGFRLRIPDELLDGRKLKLSVRDAATGEPIGYGSEEVVWERPPAFSVALKQKDETTLSGTIRPEPDARIDSFELDLWVDGCWAERLFLLAAEAGSTVFECAMPERVRDGEQWTEVLDGERHEFTLTLAERSLALESVSLRTPVRTYSVAPLKALAPNAELPRWLQMLEQRLLHSALFDEAYFSDAIRKDFPTARDALRFYLSQPEAWGFAPSAWFSPAYVRQLMDKELIQKVSPLEWYLRQDELSNAGPNVLFSNRDYVLYAGMPEEPIHTTLFDHWLQAVEQDPGARPSALVLPEHVSRLVLKRKRYDGPGVVGYLADWLATPAAKRKLSALGPCFDDDWLEQCFLLKSNRPEGCVLAAFRRGAMLDQSPHPVLQAARSNKDYYLALVEYERLHKSVGIDEIARVSEVIDASVFYQWFPRSSERSSLLAYLAEDRAVEQMPFIKGLDEEFFDLAYPGLVAYGEEHRAIADVNYLWCRWIRLLGLPGNYAESMADNDALLTIQDIRTLRDAPAGTDEVERVSFVIPSYGRDDLVLRCVLSALQAGDPKQVQFYVAEDAASIDCAWILPYFMPYLRVQKNPENLGFLLNCKSIVPQTRGEVVLLVNNDVIVHRNAIDELLSVFDRKADAAVVGGMILNANGTVQENGGMLWRDASAWNYHRDWTLDDEYLYNLREVDYVSGCWIGIRRDVWDELGGFDERYVPAYYEESDLCLQAWHAGYKVYLNPHSVVTHLDGATMGQDVNDDSSLKAYQRINRDKLQQKWAPLLDATYRKNGEPTVFHTGREGRHRFVSVVFDHYIPEPDKDAGSRTMFVVCEALAAIEGNYVLFVPANNHRSEYAKGLEQLGIEVIAGAEGWKRFDTLLESHADQVAYAFVSRLGVAKQFAWHLDKLKCRKAIYFHDIESLRGFHNDPSAPGNERLVEEAVSQYVKKHAPAFAKFDDVISLSEEESALLRPYLGHRIVDIFPYDFEPVSKLAEPARRKDILFVGSYNHPPNREAIQYFLQHAWPQFSQQEPGADLHLCGSGFEQLDSIAQPGVVVHGKVSDQTLEYLYSVSRLSIAPLLSGAGMKGKVIESCARSVPCVGTEIAWQGITLPKAHALLAGPATDIGARMVAAYKDYEGEKSLELVQVYERWRKTNRIADEIPRLVLQSKEVLAMRRSVS